MPKQYVTFRYIDGRLPPGRTVEMAPAKIHEVAASSVVEVVAGWESYVAWCSGHGHRPLARRAASAKPARVAPSELALDDEPDESVDDADEEPRHGWPTGYTFTKRRSFYAVTAPDGADVGRTRGEIAAQGLAWDHFQSARSATASPGDG